MFSLGNFLHRWNNVRINTKGIYIQKSFVYMRTGVYCRHQTLLIS